MKLEAIKFANNKVSLIIELLLDQNGYNKTALVLVQRDENDKATCTVNYYLDIPVCKVLFSDFWGRRPREFQEYKALNGTERGIKIIPGQDGYRVSILNKGKDGPRHLYFDLTVDQLRAMSRHVLDLIHHYQTAAFLARFLPIAKE